jgi:hypothetical protein
MLGNIFIWNNGIANILDSKLRTDIHAIYTVVTRPFLSSNDCGKKIHFNRYIKNFVNMVQALKHFK